MNFLNKICFLLSLLFVSFKSFALSYNEPYSDIPDYGQKYLSPDFIEVVNGNIYITARTSKELIILKKDKEKKVIKLDSYPSGLAISEDGRLAYVSVVYPKAKIIKIDISNAKILKQVQIGHSPRGIELSSDEKFLYVADQFKNELIKLDVETLSELNIAKLIREPYAIAQAGEKLFVINQLPKVDVDFYAEDISAKVSVLGAKDLKKITDIKLPNGSINLKDIVVDKENRYGYISHIIARYNVPTSQIERGWINTNALSIIDINKNKLLASVLLDDVEQGSANPYGLCFSDDGKYIFVAISGTGELMFVDKNKLLEKLEKDLAQSKNDEEKIKEICNNLNYLGDIKKRVKLDGYGCRHLSTQGDFVYVAMYYSDNINKVNIKTYEVEKLLIGGNENLNQIRQGDLYFHDGGLSFQGWLSCVSCHTQVRSDSLNWDLLNDGIGNPKQSKSMLYAHFTPPSMITGVRKNAEIAVRNGIRYIQFTERPEEDALAIDAYLRGLRAIESPYLNDENQDRRNNGEILFETSACSTCHSGEYYTDLKRHDVGTGTDQYLGFAFDTPTLREVWRTSPYLYDGRAHSIFDMLKFHNKDDKHGKTSHLSDEELQDLCEYVLGL